jgi:hypothetical protein
VRNQPSDKLVMSAGTYGLSGHSFTSRPYDGLNKRDHVVLGTILIIVLILLLVGALPTWGHSRSWGYFPSGGLGLILLIVIVLLLMGRL